MKGNTFGYYAALIGIFTALLTSIYSWRLFFKTFHGNFNNQLIKIDKIHESPMIMIIPLIVLAVGSIFSGYFFKDLLEAGIVLKGSEIKSVRSGKVNIAESYAVEKNGEIFLINSHIPIYKEASYSNHNPYEERNLLFNKKEINKLIGKVNQEGFTLIPTKMYFKKGRAKIEIAVAKGKKQHDKRQTKKTRDWNREKARYFRKSS